MTGGVGRTTIGSSAIRTGGSIGAGARGCVAFAVFLVCRVDFKATTGKGGDVVAPRLPVRRVATGWGLTSSSGSSMGISILTGLDVGSLMVSGGMTEAAAAGWAVTLLRVLRLDGIGAGFGIGSEIGAGGGSTVGEIVAGVGLWASTTNGSQIMWAKLVLILIFIECGRWEVTDEDS